MGLTLALADNVISILGIAIILVGKRFELSRSRREREGRDRKGDEGHPTGSRGGQFVCPWAPTSDEMKSITPRKFRSRYTAENKSDLGRTFQDFSAQMNSRIEHWEEGPPYGETFHLRDVMEVTVRRVPSGLGFRP